MAMAWHCEGAYGCCLVKGGCYANQSPTTGSDRPMDQFASLLRTRSFGLTALVSTCTYNVSYVPCCGPLMHYLRTLTHVQVACSSSFPRARDILG